MPASSDIWLYRLERADVRRFWLENFADAATHTMPAVRTARAELHRRLDEHGGRHVGPRGKPHENVVEALEAYVAVLTKADRWSTRLASTLKLLRAKEALHWFQELVREGANPDFLAQQVLDYVNATVGKGAKVATRGNARTMRRHLEECATVYEMLWRSAARQLGEQTARRHLNPILTRYLKQAALGVARVMRVLPARASQAYEGQLLDVLQSHLVTATGSPQHKRLSMLMSALHPSDTERSRYTEDALAMRFKRSGHIDRRGDWVRFLVAREATEGVSLLPLVT